jgi:phosphoenolpyruvate carboxykinase (ATP)
MGDRMHHHQASARAGELGVTAPQAGFSTCFGAPFNAPRPDGLRHSAQAADPPRERAELVAQLARDGRTLWPGSGMPIVVTRTLLPDALDGSLGMLCSAPGDEGG